MPAAPVVDVSKPADVVRYILSELQRHGVTPKEALNRGVYGVDERLAEWQLGDTTRDRDETLKIALKYVRDGNSRASGRHGYAATWAAPGSGKTHLLDVIVANIGSEADLRDRFVPIPITFNGQMNADLRGVRGLVARMIHVHFVGLSVPFREAFDAVVAIVDALWPRDDDRNGLYVVRTLKAIAFDFATARNSNAKPVVPVLLVDEIVRSTATANADEIAAVYRAATEYLADCRVILTALDPAAIRAVSYAIVPDKPITWLPLPRLHTDDWETEAGEKDRLLARLIAMAAGHPRTIAIVRLAREQYPSDSDVTPLLIEVAKLSDTSASLSWPFLVPAFTGELLLRDQRYDNSTYSFAQTVAAGALQNAVMRSDLDALAPQVPRPSLFTLYAHASSIGENESQFDRVAAKCVQRMVMLLTSPISGFQFEEFHAHWHALVMLLYSRRSDLTTLRLVAKDFFAMYRNPLVSVGRTVELDRSIPTPATAVLKVEQNISDATLVDWTVYLKSGRVPRLEFNQVVLPGAPNNEGFDALVLHKTAITGEAHLVIIECKWSTVDATTTLSWAAAKDGIQKKVESVRAYLDAVLTNKSHPICASGIQRADQVTMLVIANRAENSVFEPDARAWLDDAANKVHFNVAVLTRVALLDVYGDVLRNAVVSISK